MMSSEPSRIATTKTIDAPRPPAGGQAGSSVSQDSPMFLTSQAHLLKPTSDNPLPTAVPPPIAATAGTLGVRHVLSLIGLPERGKPFIAGRLQSYLSFFHGAEVKLFNINDYCTHEAGSDENAEALLQDMREFMDARSSHAGRNMDAIRGAQTQHAIPCSSRDSISDVRDSNKDELLIAEEDKRRKNVDSGKVAIIYCTDSITTFKDKWSGTSKERRRSALTEPPTTA